MEGKSENHLQCGGGLEGVGGFVTSKSFVMSYSRHSSHCLRYKSQLAIPHPSKLSHRTLLCYNAISDGSRLWLRAPFNPNLHNPDP